MDENEERLLWQQCFAKQRYLILESVLTDPLLSVAYQYVLKRAVFSCETTGDVQTPGTPSFYADPLMETLLELVQSVAEAFSGLELLPTCSYGRVYRRGAGFGPHIDRPACEITLSLPLGHEAPAIWPLHVGTPDGVQTAMLLPGDAILYRSSECPHWRGAFEGQCHVQASFHFVDRHGVHAAWQFDRRPALGVRDVGRPGGIRR